MEEKSITPEGIINQAMGMNMSFAGAEFPVEIFPSKIQQIIHEVYECQSYPIDYTSGRECHFVCSIGRPTGCKQKLSPQLCHEALY